MTQIRDSGAPVGKIGLSDEVEERIREIVREEIEAASIRGATERLRFQYDARLRSALLGYDEANQGGV